MLFAAVVIGSLRVKERVKERKNTISTDHDNPTTCPSGVVYFTKGVSGIIYSLQPSE